MVEWTNTLHVPKSHKNELLDWARERLSASAETLPGIRPSDIKTDEDAKARAPPTTLSNTGKNLYLLVHKFKNFLLIKI